MNKEKYQALQQKHRDLKEAMKALKEEMKTLKADARLLKQAHKVELKTAMEQGIEKGMHLADKEQAKMWAEFERDLNKVDIKVEKAIKAKAKARKATKKAKAAAKLELPAVTIPAVEVQETQMA